MFKFILKRILMVIPTFIAITFVTFALIHFIPGDPVAVSYTHLRAHETDSYLVCRLLLEKKKTTWEETGGQEIP